MVLKYSGTIECLDSTTNSTMGLKILNAMTRYPIKSSDVGTPIRRPRAREARQGRASSIVEAPRTRR